MPYTIKQILLPLSDMSWRSIATASGQIWASLASLILIPSRIPAAAPHMHLYRDGSLPVARIDAEQRCAAPMQASAQWRRIADVVEHSIEANRLVSRRQAEALTQLDAAEFALSKLVDELSAVMPSLRRSERAGSRAPDRFRPALAA
jgi:hypothetical protein